MLIYEMHCGYAPFFDDNNFSTYEKILESKVDWPKWINPVAKVQGTFIKILKILNFEP